jgi:hypothetical protein
MSLQSWIGDIQGLTTLLSGGGVAAARRQTMKFFGVPVFDDGTQSVFNGVQTITGSGTWDAKSGIIVVLGSGARTIAFPDPDPAVAHRGLRVTMVDAVGNATANPITADPAGAGLVGSVSTLSISVNWGNQEMMWLSAGQWIHVGGID